MEEIIKVLRWFYTDPNGNEYMNLYHCTLMDLTLVCLTVAGCLVVLTLYLLIALDAFKKAKGYTQSATKEYMMALMKTFIFCGITGYGYTVLSVWVNPYWLRVILLIALIWQAFRMLKLQKVNTSIQKTYEQEEYLAEKYKVEIDKKTSLLDLFTRKVKGVDNSLTLITYDQLNAVPFGTKFFSDETEVIENERINKEMCGFSARSTMKPDSYVPHHQHDTWKVLTCVKGRFHDSKTNKWYEEGTCLVIPACDPQDIQKHWHDIKTDDKGCELLTYILPKQ